MDIIAALNGNPELGLRVKVEGMRVDCTPETSFRHLEFRLSEEPRISYSVFTTHSLSRPPSRSLSAPGKEQEQGIAEEMQRSMGTC